MAVPMLDAHIPQGALTPAAERALLARLTDVLLEHEGADPANPVARSLTKIWLQRPAAVYVAGEATAAPHYRIVATLPEGQYDDERRAAMVAAITEAVLEAEQDRFPPDPLRVWVFPVEVPDGSWGGAGRIFRLADIAALVMGDEGRARAYAERRLARTEPAPA